MKKNYYYFLMVTLLLIVGTSFSINKTSETTTTLSGKVVDDEGEPVILGAVALYQSNQLLTGVETDFDGNYQFPNVTAGIYDVEFSYVGFPTLKVKNVNIKQGKKNILNAELKTGVQLDCVLVVDYREPLIEVDNVCSGGIVTSEEIGRLPMKDIGSIASSTAGVATTKNRSDGINVRNGRKENTSIIIDGVRVSGNMIPQSETEQLQIPTGGTPAEYGKVQGGIIHIKSKNKADGFSSESEYKQNKPILNYNEEPISNDDHRYVDIIENPFLSPIKEALSTFSIDVDRASYANVRRYINEGIIPPPNAVRIEEMINYFEYDYPQPKGKHPFAAETQLGECPWNKKHQLLHIGVQGKTVKQDDLPPSNLVFLIDVSGSMTSQDKLPLLKSGFKMMVNQLTDKDRVSIVVYAGAAGVVLEPTSGADKNKIIEALDKLRSGGSTAGGAGIQLAYKKAKEYFLKDGNNRVILATDGDFNVGTSHDEPLVKLIEKERESGVFLSVLGFGTGNYMDGKMQQIADAGNGNHSYIDNLKEAQKILVHEMNGTLHTIAKDVKIQIEFNPNFVQSYRLIGYENRILNKEDFNDDTKDAGEIGSGHSVTAIYEIIPVGVESDFSTSVDPLKFQKNEEHKVLSSSNLAWIKFRYKQPDGKKSIKFEQGISADVKSLKSMNENYNWTTSIAEFGMLLRHSKYSQESSFAKVIKRAQSSKGEDKEGYRSEFIQLVKSFQSLSDTAQK